MFMKLWQKILIGMVLGVLAGIAFGDSIAFLKPLGDIFISLLKLAAVPLVLTSIIYGITSLSDMKTLGRIGIKTISLYLITTCFAISFGLAFAHLIEPGKAGGVMENITSENFETPEKPDLGQVFTDIFPSNIFFSLSQGEFLQIIVFAILFGIALNMAGGQGRKIIEFNNALMTAFEKLVQIILNFAPIGVFALIAWVIGNEGVDVLRKLLEFVITFLVAGLLHVIIVYGFLLIFVAKLNWKKFLQKAFEVQIFGFSTSSSSATLPITIKTATEMGVTPKTRGLVLPIGATINMDGTALYQGICVMFVAQAWGIDLSFIQILMVVLMAVLASIGTAGVPGIALVTLTMIFETVGLPLEGIAIIYSIDRLLDMLRTTINVSGDLVVCTAIDRSEGSLDDDIFDGVKSADTAPTPQKDPNIPDSDNRSQ